MTRPKATLLLLSMVTFSSALLAIPREALAADPAAAEALFNEARALVVRGDYASACPKLEESQRLDAGMGTLFNLADCYEHVGKTASAWAAFREVASAAKVAGQAAREADARTRAAAIEPSLVKLVVEVSPGASSAPSLVVKRDAIEIGRPQWGSAMPIDPGKHAFVATAEGRKPWRTEIVIAATTPSTKIVIPALEDAARSPSPALTIAPSTPKSAGGTQRMLGLVIGGVGVVGLGVGSFFGLRSMARHDDAQAHCDSNNECDAQGLSLRDDARQAGNVSTGLFIAGGALLAGGAALFFTAPRAASSAAATSGKTRAAATAVGLVPGGVTVKGAF